jgi:hypothetical protein
MAQTPAQTVQTVQTTSSLAFQARTPSSGLYDPVNLTIDPRLLKLEQTPGVSTSSSRLQTLTPSASTTQSDRTRSSVSATSVGGTLPPPPRLPHRRTNSAGTLALEPVALRDRQPPAQSSQLLRRSSNQQTYLFHLPFGRSSRCPGAMYSR